MDFHELQRSMFTYYDQRAPEFDDWYDRRGRYNDPRTNAAWHAQVAELGREAARWGGTLAHRPQARVLDLACGTGKWTPALVHGLPSGGYLSACDYSLAMLELARARLEEEGPEYRTKASFIQADAYALPFPDNTFDLVFTGFLLSHIPHDKLQDLLNSLKRILKPGGNLLVFDSAMRPGVQPELVDRRTLNDGSYHAVLKINYTHVQLEALLKSVFAASSARQTRDFFLIGQANK